MEPTIQLDSQEYRLARQQTTQAAFGPSARRWQVDRKPITTKRLLRSNVRPGEIEGEYVITYDDWSKGVTGDHNPLPGTVYECRNVNPTSSGRLLGVGYPLSVLATTDTEGGPCFIGRLAATLYIVWGRYVYTYSGGTLTLSKDFGAGKLATDAVVFGNELVVAMGTTEKIWKLVPGTGIWTQAGDNVYAEYLAVVEDKLWKAQSFTIESLASGDDPLTLTNWSASITIGDSTILITDLNAYGERVAVSKENGLFMGDSAAIFPNVLPQLETMVDRRNGQPTFVRGSQIFYCHQKGCILYDSGVSAEIGILDQMAMGSSTDDVPGWRITAMAAGGDAIWAATDIMGYPRELPTGFLKTTDNEATYTSYLTQVTDNDNTTAADLSNLSTAANGGYWYVSYSAPWYGMLVDLLSCNLSMAGTLAGEYWNGAAWAALPAIATCPNPIIDETTYGGVTLGLPGFIYWRGAPDDWAEKAINGVTGYWMRFNVSAALDANTKIRSVRILTSLPRVTIYRGRTRQTGDVFAQPIIWEPMFSMERVSAETQGMTKVTCLAVKEALIDDVGYGGNIWAGARNILRGHNLLGMGVEQPVDSIVGKVILPKDDAGMPEVNKQWLDITVKGRVIDATHTIDLHYRCDETATWLLAAANIAVSGTRTALTSTTGKSMQLCLTLDDASSDRLTEINEIEVRFRVLDTFKNQYKMLLEVADGQTGSVGNPLPEANVQLTALEALQGGGTKTLVDPTGRSKTVTVDRVTELEYLQEAVDYPVLLVEVIATEI